MADPEHLERLRQGVGTWNKWRQEQPQISPDLWGADLSGADLSRADLTWAILSKADLQGASLAGANLDEADLGGASLRGADLHGATLSEADLSDANLFRADLNYANLTGANLSQAGFGYTVLGAIDLSQVRGLEAVKHHGPSTIGIDTFFRSKGRIPEDFLRGAGVPDLFLQYAASLAGVPLGFYSCLISYSAKDEALAQRLQADLQAQGVRCWYTPEDLKTGDEIRLTIGESIRVCDKLLLLLSEHSVGSQWAEPEIATALRREREQNCVVLYPIRLDQAVMEIKTGWPAHLVKTRNIGDFTKWKVREVYQKAFDRLLRDLQAGVKKEENPAVPNTGHETR